MAHPDLFFLIPDYRSHHQQHHRQLMASMTTVPSASPAASTPTVAEIPVTVAVSSVSDGDVATTAPASSSPNASATASAPQVSPNATMVAAAHPATFLVVQQPPAPQQSPTGASSNTSKGTTTPSATTTTTTSGRSTTGRTFFRAPGLLEAPDEGSVDLPTNALVCPDCGFSCSSKFHYNSHRNIHCKHQCPMCNFETRTEGRLKKHMLQSHKREQRLAHGINIQSPPPPQQQLQATVQQHSPGDRNGGGLGEQHTMQMMVAAPPKSMNSLPNSMFPGGIGAGGDNGANGSLALESLQSMLNNSNSIDALPKIGTDAIANGDNGGIGGGEKGFHSPSATVAELAGGSATGQIPLDQLRAVTERHTASMLNSSNPMSGAAFGHMQIGPDGELIDGSRQNGDAKPEHNTTSGVTASTAYNPTSGTTTGGSTPRHSGKPKQSSRCKQCPHVSGSKQEQWEHARLHIPEQKQLTCNYPQCDFVTEYKHHLEYHYRNHNGQKPFKCTMCEYTCDQTKYCHSLKMHLKTYNHKRAPEPSGFVDSSDSHGEVRKWAFYAVLLLLVWIGLLGIMAHYTLGMPDLLGLQPSTHQLIAQMDVFGVQHAAANAKAQARLQALEAELARREERIRQLEAQTEKQAQLIKLINQTNYENNATQLYWMMYMHMGDMKHRLQAQDVQLLKLQEELEMNQQKLNESMSTIEVLEGKVKEKQQQQQPADNTWQRDHLMDMKLVSEPLIQLPKVPHRKLKANKDRNQ